MFNAVAAATTSKPLSTMRFPASVATAGSFAPSSVRVATLAVQSLRVVPALRLTSAMTVSSRTEMTSVLAP